MDNNLTFNKPWILQRADPYIYRHTDGTYYFTASVPAYDKIVGDPLYNPNRHTMLMKFGWRDGKPVFDYT